MEIYQNDGDIFICQEKYVEKILNIFDMSECKPKDTPLVVNEKLMKEDGLSKVDATLYRSLVGKLLYLPATKPDIMFAASLLSRFMHNPGQIHMGVGKRILRYLQGTKDFGIMCVYMVLKKPANSRTIISREYVAAALATSQAIWLRRIFEDIGEKKMKPTTIFCDSMSTIAIAKNPVHHSRTKHIALKHHFIREAIEEGEVQLEFCGTNDQLDIFTKALLREKLSSDES
ncbi:hypothetical protein Tco_0813282 [Tanacetum coccineum]